MRARWKIVAFGFLAVMTAAAVRASAAPLEPVGKWDLNYGDADCLAFRDYGNVQRPITLALTESPNGETFEILVARRSDPPEYAQELQGSVDFGSGPINAWLLRYRSPTKGYDVYQFRIPAADMAQAPSAKAVTLRLKDASDFAFTLEAMQPLLKGLDACTADLKHYWNMDGEKDGRIAKPARGDIRKVFRSSDYPSEAMHHSQEGDTRYLLLVDEKGKVAGCHLLLASGVPVLDAMGCAVIQERARFLPARDSSGKAVRSTVVTPRIRWRIG
jgi:TonB family protein